MDVGADEFEQSLPLLQELVLGADFVGLDIEFTGLRSNQSRPQQISLFDLPSEWYLKTRQSVQQFTICQIGLSVFSSIEGESNKYVAHSCNFFLFPTTFGVLDSEFSFQASSVQFLNQYGFDYNKFLKNGIPYMNEEQEKKIKHNILTGNWKVRSSLDKDQIKVVIDEVTRWLDLAEEGDWMTLPGIAGFQAFEIQLVLRQALPNIWTVLRDQGIIVKKVSKQHRWYLENTSCDRESCWKEKILLSARGFSVFFQMLVKAQKQPLVGHNMMTDLLHLHEKFFRPLPESYDQFKLNIHSLFPVLIDTKNVTKDIWKELNFPRVSNLSEVYEVLNSDLNPTKSSGPVIIHASKCEKYAETKYPHEAAYDAFLCGSVLLKVAHLLLWRVHG
ncbi:poly(A)-specific ribonuclease PNLDC1 isoform X1 [Panthera uncia]|nr:poly(A)-specific ribonuclease PNLDC1 isoform X1 [Panthera uncia]